jgi:hypothetical protein
VQIPKIINGFAPSIPRKDFHPRKLQLATAKGHNRAPRSDRGTARR